MPDELLTHPIFILVLGVSMVTAMLVKAGLERIGLPALVGYLLMGLAIRFADGQCGFLNDSGKWSIQLLGELGVICILFRVGLENDPRQLLRQLPRAVPIWIGNVVFSVVVAFFAARYFLRLDLIPSLFISTALSATSVGVSVMVWQDAGWLKTELGEKLIDVAELDDISAIILMVLLFAVAPMLRGGMDSSILFGTMFSAGLLILSKVILFGGICFAFAMYAERRITRFFARFERAPDPMIGIVGISFMIAALAGWLGFSVAVGALFAGLAFSRDPDAVKMESSFLPVYEWLTPFFFIAIGLNIAPENALASLGLGIVLLMVAAAGKWLGTMLPALLQYDFQSAHLLSMSMIPRAEIALVIMQTGHELGAWAVPSALYGAMVFVSACTCIVTPIMLNRMFKSVPPKDIKDVPND